MHVSIFKYGPFGFGGSVSKRCVEYVLGALSGTGRFTLTGKTRIVLQCAPSFPLNVKRPVHETIPSVPCPLLLFLWCLIACEWICNISNPIILFFCLPFGLLLLPGICNVSKICMRWKILSCRSIAEFFEALSIMTEI